METGLDTCVMFKMADGIGTEETLEQIDSVQQQSGDKEVPDREINGDIEEEPAKGSLKQASGGSKKKKKKKKKGDVESETSPESLVPSSGVNLQSLRQLQNLQKSFELLRAGEVKAPKTTEEALKKKYQFWDTQPVPKLGGFCLVLFRLVCSWIPSNCI